MFELDDIDRNILRILEHNGRISNSDLARSVNLSASACLRRVQALEREGVISGYRAILNREALGSELTVYVSLSLQRHLKKDAQAFERAMKIAPEVKECHSISGTSDYILRVETRDLAAYKYFHDDVLGNVEQISTYVSHFVISSPKNERG